MNAIVEHLGPFHHVGVAVADIEQAARFYEAAYGAKAEPDEFEDPLQQVKIRFMLVGGLRIELLQPLTAEASLNGLLRRGIALYHTCHEVTDMEAALDHLRSSGVMIVSPPKPAIAFGGRRVAFTMYQGMMIELLESAAAATEYE
ncbi:MAG: VOC family protein [Phycisphaerae bacterium]|nr:VOC family protein [Phycisphaerae bacterium]